MNDLTINLLKTIEFNKFNFVESYDKNVFSFKTKSTFIIDNVQFKINCRQSTSANMQNYSVVSIKLTKDQKTKLLVKTKDLKAIFNQKIASKEEWVSVMRQMNQTTQIEGLQVKQCIQLLNEQARTLEQQKNQIINKKLQEKASLKADECVKHFCKINWNLENEMEQCDLQPNDIQLIKDNGAAFCDVTEFLLNLADLPKETTVIGLNHKNIIQGVSTTLKCEDYMDAYHRIFKDCRARSDFLDKLTEENHPIVFLVPHKLFGPKRGITANEMDWFLKHPDKMENVYFVFRAYKVYSKKSLPSISNEQDLDSYSDYLTARIFQQIQANYLLPTFTYSLEDEKKLQELETHIQFFEMNRPHPFKKPTQPPIIFSSSQAIVPFNYQNYQMVAKLTVGLKTLKATRAIFLMGAMGSGKGKLSELMVQEHPERNYAVIDPDQIKASEKLGHEGSVEKATQLLKFTIEEKKNFIYESTGSRFWIYEEQMKAAKKKGMFVELIYVETQLANCLSRAQTRGIETRRFVPEESVRLSHKIAQDFFPDLREYAHQWKKYNNDGPKPRLVESYKAT